MHALHGHARQQLRLLCLHAYDHAKHGQRPLSVHVAGSCPSYVTDPAWAAGLVRSGFDRFVKGGAGG